MRTVLKTGRVIGLPMAIWYKNYGLLPSVPEQKGKWRVRALPRFAKGGGVTAAPGGTGCGVIKDKAGGLRGPATQRRQARCSDQPILYDVLAGSLL
ncbi:hypothetical protein [Streptomyces dysideae]|uniref:Uncharacterized protein n=1 Tax=Streptomyces dysideae TaxID=909626 RepID=A0A101UV69_9ACTN|nr:hypothetical protein [Streptomyces dysideae]KUO17425.1 hypothetical protein AQJ91_30285 [Streptomyces dysideae]